MSGVICEHGVNSIDRRCPECAKASGDALRAAFTPNCGDVSPYGCLTCTKERGHAGDHRGGTLNLKWPRARAGEAECHEDDLP